MNHKDLFNLLKTVKKNIRCPQCGKQYDFSEIKIKGIAESIVFLELGCSNHMPVLATVALTKNNTLKLPEEFVNNNDVIETYKFFEKFNGGFEKLFNNQKLDKTDKKLS